MSNLPYFCLGIKTLTLSKGAFMLSKVIISLISLVFLTGAVACNEKTTKLGVKAKYHSASKELLFKIDSSNDRDVISKAAKNVADLATPCFK